MEIKRESTLSDTVWMNEDLLRLLYEMINDRKKVRGVKLIRWVFSYSISLSLEVYLMFEAFLEGEPNPNPEVGKVEYRHIYGQVRTYLILYVSEE